MAGDSLAGDRSREGRKVEVHVQGMDCAECTWHVRRALTDLPGVLDAEVYLAGERAILSLADEKLDMDLVRKAVADAGYRVVEEPRPGSMARQGAWHSRQVTRLTALVFVAVVLIVVAGEWLGLFERIADLIPWWLGLAVVLIGGLPVFRNVARAALRRQVISHTLMSLGVVAALAVGEWVTATIVVFFMRVGDYVEHFTADRARDAVRRLSDMAPQTARVIQNGQEHEVPIDAVEVGQLVVVRPGEMIPVDGLVEDGQATVDQAAITGESAPLEAAVGARVFAASLVQFGYLRVSVEHVGHDTTFGRVIQLVQEAEANRGQVQRFADKFSGYYLPVVAGIAAMTYIWSGNALAAAAVLVVACSCSIALATPIAILASVGAAARSGLLLKGGRYIEALARADVLLIDKTGTLTLGRATVTDVIGLNGHSAQDVLALAASAERYSEHPLARAVKEAALQQEVVLSEASRFESVPGMGVQATVNGRQIVVGNRALVRAERIEEAERLSSLGKSVFYVSSEQELLGLLAVSDTLRPEVPQAIGQLRLLGIETIQMLTGDNAEAAAHIASQLGIDYRAELLPEEKIKIVKEHQALGRTVVMIGDGVNDAPALAQADVGVAMGAAGSDIALEAAHAALMRDDWLLVVDLIEIARRTMRVVRMNLGFTGVYNVIGLSLAALGILTPVVAAALQSIPDLGILANSSRLLKVRPRADAGHTATPAPAVPTAQSIGR
jgi:P-type Cu+ transporter